LAKAKSLASGVRNTRLPVHELARRGELPVAGSAGVGCSCDIASLRQSRRWMIRAHGGQKANSRNLERYSTALLRTPPHPLQIRPSYEETPP
jgi:hypothetical protein